MSIEIKFDPASVARVVDGIKKAGRGAIRAVGEGLYDMSTELMDRSQALVPIDTGELKEHTAFVTLPMNTVNGTDVRAGYGATYAIFVHNKPATHTPPTRDKFLEIPFNEMKSGFEGKLAVKARRFFKTGSKAARGKYAVNPREEREVGNRSSRGSNKRLAKRTKQRRKGLR